MVITHTVCDPYSTFPHSETPVWGCVRRCLIALIHQQSFQETQINNKPTVLTLLLTPWVCLSCFHGHRGGVLFIYHTYYTEENLTVILMKLKTAELIITCKLFPLSPFLPRVSETVINPPDCSALNIICSQLGSSSPTSQSACVSRGLFEQQLLPTSAKKKSLDEF